MSILIEQAIVIPFFDDPAFFHDDDSVRGLDGGQPVRDQNARGICQDQAQRLLDLPFGERINAGGLVMDAASKCPSSMLLGATCTLVINCSSFSGSQVSVMLTT